MRKAFILFVVFFLSLTVGFSLDSPVNPFFENPARLFFFNQAKTLGVDMHFGLSPELSENDPFFSSPYMGLKAEFTSKYAQAGFTVDFSFSDRNPQEEAVYYNIYNDVAFNVGAAYGYKAVGFGFQVEAGSKLQRLNCAISREHAFQDFFTQALFAEYDRVSGSETVNLKFGLGVEVEPVSFYILSPSAMTYHDNSTHFDLEEIYRGLKFGLYYTGDRFGIRGRLKPVVFDAGISVSSAFDETDRSLEVAGAVTLQLSRDRNISLRGSYCGPLFNSSAQRLVFAGLSYTAEYAVFSTEATVPLNKEGHSYFTFITSLLF